MYFDEWSPDLVTALEEPFAPGDHKDKRQGGSTITFVDVHKYKERLNATVGPHGWSSTLRLEPIGGKLICTVALTVLGVTKENVGDEVEVPDRNEKGNEKIVGGPATNSYAQAFKRAASDFGLGSYLYDEAKRNAAKKGGGQGAPARTNGDGKATEAQTTYLRNLLKSSVFSDAEREHVTKQTASGGRAAVSGAIKWCKEQVDERQAVPA
jgi:hypothetical protein